MNGLKLFFVNVTIAVLMCLVACSKPVSWIVVDASDSGDAVKIGVGDELFVDLDSNPSTGFQWKLVEISDSNVLSNENSEYKASEVGNTVGTGGIERWTFKALNKGTARLYMEYSQPWDGGMKAAETFTLIVVVD